jgi:hypothetical protein
MPAAPSSVVSKIVVVVTRAADQANAIAAIRQFDPTLSIAEIKLRLAASAPIIEVELFTNEFPEVARRLRQLAADLARAAVDVRWFELQPEDTFDCTTAVAQWEVSDETLVNILAEAKNYE